MKKQKLLEKALRGPNNLSFSEIVVLVEAFGFHLSRINGSIIYLCIQESRNL